MHMRKERGGSGAAGYYWENDGDVVEVPDHIAFDLLDVKGHDFTYVEPEDVAPRSDSEDAPEAETEAEGQPEGESAAADDASAEKPKRKYTRRTATDRTEVSE